MFLLALFGCNTPTDPASYGVIRVTVSSVCVSAERVQAWIGTAYQGDRSVSPTSSWLMPNVPTGSHAMEVFRFRYTSGHQFTTRVATGFETQVQLNCPDGITRTEPP